MGTMPSTFRKRKTLDYMPDHRALSTTVRGGDPDYPSRRRSGRTKGSRSEPLQGSRFAHPGRASGMTCDSAPGLFQPPRRIMSKKSRLVLLAFILSSMNSIASISSIG